MGKPLFIFYAIFWVCGRVYFLAPTYLDVKIYHSIGLHFDILCLLAYITSVIPYTDLKRKLFWAYFFLYELFGFATFTHVQLNGDNVARAALWAESRLPGSVYVSPMLTILEQTFIPVFVAIVAYQLYKRVARFDFCNSAKLNDYNIFLALRYPNNMIGLFLTLFTPVKATTVGIYADGVLYKFKRSDGVICQTYKSKESMSNGEYFMIDTGIKKSQKIIQLKSLIGKKWSFLRNCLNSYSDVIGPIKKYL